VVPFEKHDGFVGRNEDLARVHALLQKGEAVGEPLGLARDGARAARHAAAFAMQVLAKL
jgi:hypothetical protein